MNSRRSSSSSNGSEDCYVDSSYRLIFILPAIVILLLLAFLKKRRSYKTHVWGGRPGIVIPINILDINHDRLAIMAVFGAATGGVVHLVTTQVEDVDPWEKGLVLIIACLIFAILYYPLFACFTTKHKVLGATTGLLYGLAWLVVTSLRTFDKCLGFSKPTDYIVPFLRILPQTLCLVYVLVKYAVVLCQEIRRTEGSFSFQQERPIEGKVLVKSWMFSYVQDLLKPRFVMLDTRAMHYLRRIYSPARNFCFSTQTLSVIMTGCIAVYMISIEFLTLEVYIIRGEKTDNALINALPKGIGVSLLVATILAMIFCAISVIRFMECHKNNMIRMFKGDKSFIPESFVMSQSMVGRSLKYACFQLGYLIWGYFFILFILSLLCIGVYSLSIYEIRVAVWTLIKTASGVVVVALLLWIALPIASLTIFRDRSFSKDVIALDNRNVFMVFSYFWFFIGLPMGFFSAIFRVLKAAAIGLLLLPRIDRSVMPDGFQKFDPGFYAYVCFLYVQATFRNPILRVFCQILYDTRESTYTQRSPSSTRLRNKWFLLVTLARNPQLTEHRKLALVRGIDCFSRGELKSPVSACGSLNRYRCLDEST